MNTPSAKLDIDATVLARIPLAIHRALDDGAEALGEEIDRITPIEESTLIKSRKISRDGFMRVLSWDTPYARRQHEDTRLRHDAGREAKFAQRGLARNAARITTYIGTAIRAAL